MKPRKRLIVLFLLPASFFYIVFFLFPAFQSFYYSFFDFSGFQESLKFRGLGNYQELVGDQVFRDSLWHTLEIVFVGGVITFGLAFLLTMLIDSGIKGRKLFRAMIFLPNVIAAVAVVVMWSFAIYDPTMGVLPSALKAIGLEELSKFQFLSMENIFNAMLVSLIWISVGYYLVLFMAGVDKIPIELYECAKLEGANLFQMFRSITIPLIWDVLTVGVVMWTITSIKVLEIPLAFSGANAQPPLYTMGLYLYVMGWGLRDPIYRMGYASTIGVAMVIVVIVAGAILMRVMRREAIEY